MTEDGSIKTQEQNNRWAQIGLAIGIISIFFAPIGVIPLSGLVVNSVGIYKAKSLGGKGKWLAITGLVLSIIYTLVYLKRYGHI